MNVSHVPPDTNWIWKLLGLLLGITLLTGLISYSTTFFHAPDESRLHMPLLVFGVSGIFSVTFLGLLIPTWMFMVHYAPPLSKRNIALHSLSIPAISVGAFVVGNYLVTLFLRQTTEYEWTAQDTGFAALISTIGVILTSGIYYLNYFYRRSVQAENERMEAQLVALKSQINPHFLFNSLNSIAALVRTAPEHAERVTEDLAELFRYSLASGKKASVPLQEELDIIMVYLNIEKARFGKRLHLSVDVDENSASAVVPSLLLQPLVENAVKHGVGKTHNPVQILVSARLEGAEKGATLLRIRVEDDGPGFDSTDPAIVLTRGVGLQNISDRLGSIYGGQAGFYVLPHGVEITIPQ